MRLTCPNCGAQYEVPDEVIPTEGRDVQCSACGNTWFQDRREDNAVAPETSATVAAADPPESTRDQDRADSASPDNATDPEPDAAPLETPPRRELDPEVAEILRSEAEREARLRAGERAPDAGRQTGPTPQTEREADADTRATGVDDAPGSAAVESEPIAPGAIDAPPVAGSPPSAPDPAAVPASGPERIIDLPDEKERGARLSDADHPDTGSKDAPEADAERSPLGGFMRGFSLVILLVVALLLLYTKATDIAQIIPAAAPLLEGYVDLIDQGRVWLNATFNPPPPGAPSPAN